MKTILVPTDFSDLSENAAHQAAEIAKKTNAKIILMHVYHLPVIQTEVALPLDDSLAKIEYGSNQQLVKTRAMLHTQHGPHIQIDHVVKCGFAVDEIMKFINENLVDLVVMGMRGAGLVSEHLVGSVTTSLMHKLKVPVLAVNKNSSFNGMKKIVFAYDYAQLENTSSLSVLKQLVHFFDSHVYVLKVCPEGELNKIPEIPEAVAGVRMNHLLEGLNHSFHFTASNDVVEGINSFISEKDADLVVMIPHQYSFFRRIFSTSNSTHMAFNLKTPLLTLPE